jgi:hypothetical protein
MDLPDPDLLHDAALGCAVAVVFALELNQPFMAAKLVAVGAVLEGFALKLDRMAARRPVSPRALTLSGPSEWVSGATGSLAAGHAVVSGTAGIRPGSVVLAASGHAVTSGTATFGRA